MNILVVHPPYSAKREIIYLPLGLAYLAAVCEKQGHAVQVLDMHNLKISYRVLEQRLRRQEFQVCLMGGFAMQVRNMAAVTRMVKEIQPRCQVILGGVGVSDIPEIVLEYTGADAVSIGEAELTLPVFLSRIEEGKGYDDVQGFVWRRNGEIIKTPKGPVPDNLDEVPIPAYHLFDVEYISRYSYNGLGERSIHLMTSRGCPFKCSFCINSVLNSRELLTEIHGEISEQTIKSQRFRTPAHVVKEIEFLRSKYGITDFHFADEEFITHRRRLEEICSALEPLGITWSTSGRADWATHEKLTRMKRAGCQYVLFGVESGSQTMLDLMDKNAKKSSVATGLQSARDVGMNFIANFMIGHPGETEQTIRETVDFCKEQKLVFLPAYVTLFPNSKMFHDYAKNVKDWTGYFEGLSKIDFSRSLFINLTEMRASKLIDLRNWSIAESMATLIAPKLSRPLARLFTHGLKMTIIFMDHLPNSLRWFIRNIYRRTFDFANRQGKKSSSKQIPPHDYGQKSVTPTVDSYEESLAALQKGSFELN